jgi:hypothetical protein
MRYYGTLEVRDAGAAIFPAILGDDGPLTLPVLGKEIREGRWLAAGSIVGTRGRLSFVPDFVAETILPHFSRGHVRVKNDVAVGINVPVAGYSGTVELEGVIAALDRDLLVLVNESSASIPATRVPAPTALKPTSAPDESKEGISAQARESGEPLRLNIRPTGTPFPVATEEAFSLPPATDTKGPNSIDAHELAGASS